MGTLSLDDVKLTSLARIFAAGGDVMHAMKASDPGCNGFGEAYFSWIESGAIKAWKRHARMTMNLVVPLGRVRFVFALDVPGPFRVIEIGPEATYARVTVPPGIWFGFQGRAATPSLVLNIANIAHDPSEVQRMGLLDIHYDWN